MKTKQLILVILWAFCSVANAQKQNEMDSLKQVFFSSGDDSVRALALYKIGFRLAYPKPDSTLALADSLINFARVTGYSKAELLANQIAAMAHNYLGNYDSTIAYGIRGVEMAKARKDSSSLGAAYSVLSVAYTTKGDYVNALEATLNCYANEEALGSKGGILASAVNIGNLYGVLKDYENSLEYYKIARDIAKELSAENQLAIIEYSMGTTFKNQGKLQESIEYLQTALNMAKKLQNNNIISRCLLGLGRTHFRLKEYDAARRYASENLIHVGKFGDKLITGSTLLLLARINLEFKKYDEALNQAKQALQIAKEISVFTLLAESNEALSNIYAAMNNYKSALEYIQAALPYKDSTINEDKIKEIASLEVKYETEKQQRDIELLEKQNQIQSLQVAKQQNLIWVFTGAAVILLIFVLLLYYLFRIRQREKDSIQQKNEVITQALADKERLIREIHHRVKNNLQIIQSILDTQSIELQDRSAIAALQESKSRVQTISLIHQYLYQTNDISLDIQNYVYQLVEYIQQSLMPLERVNIEQSVASFVVDADQAVSLGLIINEALTNALKHGFNGRGPGAVNITLQKVSEDEFVLEIADNGIGLPKNFSERRHLSMGFRLIEGLTKHLGGTLTIVPAEGTTLRFVFPVQTMKLKAA